MRPALTAALLTVTALVPRARGLDAQPPGPGWEEANRTDNLVVYTHDNPKVGTRDIEAVSEPEPRVLAPG